MKTFAVADNWIEDPHHLVNSQALQFGAGLFETIRVQDNVPLLWEAHMARLSASAKALGLAEGLDVEQLRVWLDKLLREAPQRCCALKISWLAAPAGAKACFHFRPLGYTRKQRDDGLKAVIGAIRRNPHSHVTAHKTLNYLDNLLERQAAQAAGYDEAILLNIREEVAEGTATNLFIQADGLLMTPPLEAGILPGVQRQAVIDVCRSQGIATLEREISVAMLTKAEGIYLTNSLMGFMPVSNLMGNWYDKDISLVTLVNRLTGISDSL